MTDEDNDDVIFGDDEDDQSATGSNQKLSFDDVTGNRSYISSEDLQEDGGVQYEVASIERNESAKYTFSEADYAIDMVAEDGRVQTVNAWGLWGSIRQAYREASEEGFESIQGLHLRVGKEGRGEYNVAWSLDGEEFNEVEYEG